MTFGQDRQWVQMTGVDWPLVTSDAVRVFEDQTLTSTSTLRFRTEGEVAASLTASGYDVR